MLDPTARDTMARTAVSIPMRLLMLIWTHSCAAPIPAMDAVPNPNPAQTRSESMSTTRNIDEPIMGQPRNTRFLGMLPVVRSRVL